LGDPFFFFSFQLRYFLFWYPHLLYSSPALFPLTFPLVPGLSFPPTPSKFKRILPFFDVRCFRKVSFSLPRFCLMIECSMYVYLYSFFFATTPRLISMMILCRLFFLYFPPPPLLVHFFGFPAYSPNLVELLFFFVFLHRRNSVPFSDRSLFLSAFEFCPFSPTSWRDVFSGLLPLFVARVWFFS